MDLLATITALAHEFGTADFVKGGGGNTSVKTADTIWVKPSGTALASLAPRSFLALDRAKLAALYTARMPADSAAREARVKDLMLAALKPPDERGRPSVEAPLHDVLAGTFVVHTHAVLVNGMTCARAGAATCARLFPEALWVPYIDPGFTLCMDVWRRVQDYTRQRGRPPITLILENHGIIVTANSAAEVRAASQRVLEALRSEYRQAGISERLPVGPAPAAEQLTAMTERLRKLLGEEAAAVVAAGTFAVPRGPLSPDHIVYAQSFPHHGPLTSEGLAAYRQRWGTTPRVFVTEAGVFTAGQSRKVAELAQELAQDGALVQQLAAAFGGAQYLDDRAREFIENWEVEAYRQRQMA
jgi:rhamnose utilization protein RhaD (predicted bifunctional aldolase and dehydrogenase)